MANREELLKRVWAAAGRDPRVDLKDVRIDIADAIRIVLEKDRLVDQDHVHIGVHDAVVKLAGILPDEAQREMAEADAWYAFGVDDVVKNEIEVYPYPQTGDQSRRMAARSPTEERVGGPPQGGRRLP